MFGFPLSNFQSYPMFPGGGYGYGMPSYGGGYGSMMPPQGGGYGPMMPFQGSGYGPFAFGQTSGNGGMPPPQTDSPTAEANPSVSLPLNRMFQPQPPAVQNNAMSQRPGTVGYILSMLGRPSSPFGGLGMNYGRRFF